eukprot:3105240-Amphidinium_carterae.2
MEMYSLALRVLPMGDQKAMEVAQMVHQNLVLHHSPQTMSNMLTYGWRLPAVPHIWVCYCDDYMQFSILDDEVDDAVHHATQVKGLARQCHAAVLEGYNAKSFLRKAEKSEHEVKEAKFWGAQISSALGRVRDSRTR